MALALPIKVKWTDTPNLTAARHLLAFLDEQRTRAPHGQIVYRCPRPLRLHERTTALPWWWAGGRYFKSRWTACGENAGRQTAMYLAPPGRGVL